MKDKIISPLIDALRIDLNCIVELCDQFFQAKKNVYHQIVQSEKVLVDIQTKEANQPLYTQQQQTRDRQQKELNQWTNSVNYLCREVVQEVKTAYFVNRQHLVNLVMLLIINQQEQVFSIGRDLLRKPNAVMNIIKSLIRNLEWEREFSYLPKEEKNEKLTSYIYNEQICLLQSLFAFWSSNQAKKEEQEAFLEFMNLTKFQGKMRKQAQSELHFESLMRFDIKILSQLTSIAMLGFGHHNPKYLGQMTVNANQITQASSFLFLPMAVLTNQMHKYADQFNQLPLIEEFIEVMIQTQKSNFFSKSQAVSLLINWLNMLFDFEMHQQGMDRNEDLIRQIQFIGLDLLKDKSAIANVWKEGINTLKIYSEIFNNPVDSFESFLGILNKLCGSQQQQHGKKVMDFIQQKNLWPEIFEWVTIKLQHLTKDILDDCEIGGLVLAITLITKLIRQVPQNFKELNQIYTQTAEDCFKGNSRLNFDPSHSMLRRPSVSATRQSFQQNSVIQFEGGEYPLLSFLVKALHSFSMLDQKYGDNAICNLINALTKLYKYYQETQQPIMDLISGLSFQRRNCAPRLIEHMTDFTPFKTKQLISFLKFIKTAFMQEYPFSSLSENDIQATDTNFFCIALSQVYSPIVNNYLKIPFSNEKEKSQFMKVLFRLTLVLLSKFDQIRDDGQKVLIAQQTPYYDFLLHELSKALHPPQVNQMCLQAIYIVQSRLSDNQTGFYNKIQNDLSGENLSRHFILMITSAVQVLNKMLELAKTTFTLNQQRESISLQSSYILNILSIQDLYNCVCDQTTLRMEDSTLITIPALITYYVLPAGILAIDYSLRIEALKFLTSTMQIQTKNHTLAALKSTFRSNLSQQLSFFNFIKQEECVSLSVAYLDFWIQAVQSHAKFAEELLQAKDSELLVETLREPFQETFMHFKNSLKQKICILISLMSIKRCCTEILDFKSQLITQEVFKCVIEPLLKEVKSLNTVIKGDLLRNVQNIDATVIEIVTSLNAKISIFYFIKLLQSEFERVPSSKTIRSLIEKLYSNKAFNEIAIEQNLEEQDQDVFGIVQNVNENFLRDIQSRQNYNLARPQALNQDTEIQQRLQDGENSPLFTEDGSVYLSSLQGKDQLEQFEKTAPYNYYNSAVYIQNSNGMLGAQFVIDVSELKQRLKQAGYKPEDSHEVCCYFLEYNLALSAVAVNYLLLKAKAEIMLSVGQTQMQVVIQKKVPFELILTSSLLPFISGQELYPKNKDQVDQCRFLLVNWSIHQIKTLHQVIDKSKQQVQNSFLDRNLEAQFQMLILYLGIVGHIVAALGSKHKELSGEIPSVMNSLLSSLPSNSLFKKDDKETHALFCQLVTLTLQIQLAFGQKCQTTTIFQSLGQVITGMQSGHCLTEGIQIFILICDMIDTDSFVNLMNRQAQGSLIQLIISRIREEKSKISSEEMQLILTLLQSFAKSEEGSQSLFKHKILSYLINSESFKLLNDQAPYFANNQEQNRNHYHTWWLQVLVLIRQMNTNLIRNPRTSDSAYFKELNRIVSTSLQFRIQQVLQVNILPEARNVSTTSIAILEETELVCQILSQMFQHADFWFELDKNTYSEMKDLMLFAVPKVFINCQKIRLNPSSVTERHLIGINAGNLDQKLDQSLGNQNQRTALQLKMEMSLIKSIMACTASLHNIVTFQKQNWQDQIIQTWGRIHNNNEESFEQLYLKQHVGEPFMQFAFENFLKAMSCLKELHFNLRAPQNQVKKLIQSLSEVFLTDLWIQSEYKGGLAGILIEESFEELIENMEVTLAMGVYVLSGLLEHISNVLSGVIGFTGDTNYNFQLSYGGGMHDTDYGRGQIDERHLVLMAKNLVKLVQKLHETVQPGRTPWANEKYLKSILRYAESLTNPIGAIHYN